MRQLFLAALGVVAVSGVASAQYPQSSPQPPARLPAIAAFSGAPVQPASGAAVGPTVRGSFIMAIGHNVHAPGCPTGHACNNGCGSVKSDLAFHFGSCKNFFSPCGPHWGGHGKGCGGLFGGRFGGPCPTLPFAAPWGPGWTCPPIYDSHANH
jgi:hypothetical protein